MHFPILCTMQYNCHCIVTFCFVRSVNRSIPLQYTISENTGSITCRRREYNSRFTGPSVFSFISPDKFSSYFLSVTYNVLTGFLLVFTLIQFSISGQSVQVPLFAWNLCPAVFPSFLAALVRQHVSIWTMTAIVFFTAFKIF